MIKQKFTFTGTKIGVSDRFFHQDSFHIANAFGLSFRRSENFDLLRVPLHKRSFLTFTSGIFQNGRLTSKKKSNFEQHGTG